MFGGGGGGGGGGTGRPDQATVANTQSLEETLGHFEKVGNLANAGTANLKQVLQRREALFREELAKLEEDQRRIEEAKRQLEQDKAQLDAEAEAIQRERADLENEKEAIKRDHNLWIQNGLKTLAEMREKLKQEAEKFLEDEGHRRMEEIKRHGDEILRQEMARLEDERAKILEDLERERQRLQSEMQQLADDREKLRQDSEEERRRLQEELKRSTDDLERQNEQNIADERQRLQQELERMKEQVERDLQDQNRRALEDEKRRMQEQMRGELERTLESERKRLEDEARRETERLLQEERRRIEQESQRAQQEWLRDQERRMGEERENIRRQIEEQVRRDVERKEQELERKMAQEKQAYERDIQRNLDNEMKKMKDDLERARRAQEQQAQKDKDNAQKDAARMLEQERRTMQEELQRYRQEMEQRAQQADDEARRNAEQIEGERRRMQEEQQRLQQDAERMKQQMRQEAADQLDNERRKLLDEANNLKRQMAEDRQQMERTLQTQQRETGQQREEEARKMQEKQQEMQREMQNTQQQMQNQQQTLDRDYKQAAEEQKRRILVEVKQQNETKMRQMQNDFDNRLQEDSQRNKDEERQKMKAEFERENERNAQAKIDALRSQLERQNQELLDQRERELQERYRNEAERQLEQQRRELETEMNRLKEAEARLSAEKGMIDKMACDEMDIVDINVGGRQFTTTRPTLCVFRDSQLAKWFTKWEGHLPKDKLRRYFLDRNPRNFDVILDLLRAKKCGDPCPLVQMSESLIQDIKYYGLEGLQDEIPSNSSGRRARGNATATAPSKAMQEKYPAATAANGRMSPSTVADAMAQAVAALADKYGFDPEEANDFLTAEATTPGEDAAIDPSATTEEKQSTVADADTPTDDTKIATATPSEPLSYDDGQSVQVFCSNRWTRGTVICSNGDDTYEVQVTNKRLTHWKATNIRPAGSSTPGEESTSRARSSTKTSFQRSSGYTRDAEEESIHQAVRGANEDTVSVSSGYSDVVTPGGPDGIDNLLLPSDSEDEDEPAKPQRRFFLPKELTSPAAAPSTMFVMAGGTSSSGKFLNDVISCDTTTESWHLLAKMNTRRASCSAAIHKGYVVIAGGIAKTKSDALKTTEAYQIQGPDGMAGQGLLECWGDMNYGRANFASASYKQFFLAVGGYGRKVASGDRDCARYTAEVLNFHSKQWKTLPAMENDRRGCVAEVIGNQLIVAGGANCSREVEIYNFDREQWEKAAPMQNGRQGAASLVWDGKMVVVGGAGFEEAGCLEIYDPATNEWSQPKVDSSILPGNLSYASVGLFKDNILVAGGISGKKTLGRVLLVDPKGDNISKLGKLPATNNCRGPRARAAGLVININQYGITA